MELTQAKPPKKRRRWLVVALLLLLVSSVAWWHWPRGDVRFVGAWEFQRLRLNAVSAFVNLKPAPLFQFELRSNGVATVRSVTTSRNGPPQISPPLYTRWKLDGDSLIIGNPDKRPVNSYLTKCAKFVRHYLSINLMTDAGFRLTAVSIGPNEVELTTPRTSVLPGTSGLLTHYRLIRLPE